RADLMARRRPIRRTLVLVERDERRGEEVGVVVVARGRGERRVQVLFGWVLVVQPGANLLWAQDLLRIGRLRSRRGRADGRRGPRNQPATSRGGWRPLRSR